MDGKALRAISVVMISAHGGHYTTHVWLGTLHPGNPTSLTLQVLPAAWDRLGFDSEQPADPVEWAVVPLGLSGGAGAEVRAYAGLASASGEAFDATVRIGPGQPEG